VSRESDILQSRGKVKAQISRATAVTERQHFQIEDGNEGHEQSCSEREGNETRRGEACDKLERCKGRWGEKKAMSIIRF
jgi:hypothetical protein